MTEYAQKVIHATISALSAAGICFLTALLANVQSGHENPMAVKVASIGALVSLLKDIHSFTATAPKDVGDTAP